MSVLIGSKLERKLSAGLLVSLPSGSGYYFMKLGPLRTYSEHPFRGRDLLVWGCEDGPSLRISIGIEFLASKYPEEAVLSMCKEAIHRIDANRHRAIDQENSWDQRAWFMARVRSDA
jgi:hypothetical protein